MVQKINFLNFPDIDQGYKIVLGHRSIITHSILLPYILYYFFIKKRALYNKYITLIIAGIFLGIGLHLSADLFPKGWQGYALIKLPGNISIGELSPIWIGFNALVSLYFAGSCLNNLTKQNTIWITYILFGAVAGFLYSIKEPYNNETIFLAFYITFIFTFIISKLLSRSLTVNELPLEIKKIPEKDVKKLSFKDIKYKRQLNQIKEEKKSKKKLIVKTVFYAAIIIASIVIIFYLIK